MTPELISELRLVADRYGFTHEQAVAHRNEVWEKIHGKGPDRLAVVMDAWTVVPGSYSYYDTASALEIALRGTEG